MSDNSNESVNAIKQKSLYFRQQLLDNIANIDFFLTNFIHWTEFFVNLSVEARHRIVQDLLEKVQAIKEHTCLLLAQEWPTADAPQTYPC